MFEHRFTLASGHSTVISHH